VTIKTGAMSDEQDTTGFKRRGGGEKFGLISKIDMVR
jgi:hypothetical protein